MLIEREKGFFVFFFIFLGEGRYVAFASVDHKGFSEYWVIAWMRSPRCVLPSFDLVIKKTPSIL